MPLLTLEENSPSVALLLDTVARIVGNALVVAAALLHWHTMTVVVEIAVGTLATGRAVFEAGQISRAMLHTTRLRAARAAFGEALMQRALLVCKFQFLTYARASR